MPSSVEGQEVTMEEILLDMIQEASTTSKLTALKDAAKEAKATLQKEHESHSLKTSELRKTCLLPIKIALESKNNKISSLGVSGLQKLLAENRFQALLGDEKEPEDDALINQVLEALANTTSMNEDTQVEMIKLLLVMTCSAGCQMDVKSLLAILEFCLSVFSQSKAEVHKACQVTVLQIVTDIALMSHRTAQPKQMIESSPTKDRGEVNMKEVDEVICFLCKKVSETHKATQSITKHAARENPLLTLELEAIHTALSNVLQRDGENQDFQKCVWQELCPTLIGILGIPKDEKDVIAYCSTATPSSQGGDSEILRGVLEHGRGSSSLSQSPVKFKSARQVIFAIASELVRCFGRVESMKAVLASLYHRILLFPPPSQRNEALKMVAEIISTPEKLLAVAMPPVVDDDRTISQQNERSSHLGLLKLLIDGITEAAESKITRVSNSSVKCIYSLLTSLEQLNHGQGIRPQQADIILKYFQKLEKEECAEKIEGSDNLSEGGDVKDLQGGSNNRDSRNGLDQDGRNGLDEDGTVGHDDEGSTEATPHQRLEAEGAEADEIHRGDMASEQVTNGTALEGHSASPPGTDLVLNGLSSRSDEIAKMQAEAERQGAQDYANSLIGLLPMVLGMMGVTEVDEAFQQFASKFVAGYTMKKPISEQSESQASQKLNITPVINADGIYISTCYGLLLNMKLLKCNHYSNPGNLPLTQKQFVDGVHSSGVLVYLSATWLGELYRTIITRDLLGEGGYQLDQEIHGGALRTFLLDIDGMGSQEVGGQMLQEATSFYDQSTQALLSDNHPATQAGSKFTRHILTSFWQQILCVLSVPLSTNLLSEVKSHEGSSSAKEGKLRDEDALCLSLDGLRKAAELACKLGLQKRCAGVFAHLAEASCSNCETSGSTSEKGTKPRKVWPGKTSAGLRLHAVHALSMDAILSMGVEMGSHSADCWRHVFRCCAYVSQLEHTHFTKAKVGPPPLTIIPKAGDSKGGDATFDLGDLDSAPAYTPISLPRDHSDLDSDQSVQDIVKKEKAEKGFDIGSATGALLNQGCAARVLCSLSSSVDRLFEEAALKLNLQALLSFLQELCASSQLQLYRTYPTQKKVNSLVIPTSPSKSLSTSDKAETSLHLYRMGDVILKCVRQSNRPLMHLMQAWCTVAPHLVEAACHKDRHVSKRATAIIHEVLTEIFTSKMELDYFHFHEALLKPFESLLCLELCDSDVQDQVVTSICELVEASFTNIKSGWRPLFGALRAVRFSQSTAIRDATGEHGAEHPLAPVCNVFEAFLNTDNAAVFANAAIDCVLCLLKFVKATGNGDSNPDSPPPPSDDIQPQSTPQVTFDMCLPALNYLHRCHKILATIYSMPAHPLFRGSQSIKLGSSESPSQSSAPQSPISSVPEAEKCGPILFEHVKVESVDDDSGLMKVWFLLLEGLTAAVSTCPQKYQPPSLELLFEVLNSIIDIPGEEFAIFSVTELLLPMMQSWVRRNRHVHSTWDSTTSNFKHACGLTTDLVVNYFSHLLPASGDSVGVPLILRQFLDLMVECICQANESVARLGCSCIRHLFLSVGPVFTPDLWTVACRGMQRAVAASLRSIKQLITCFHPGSEEFMGDSCQVKVAARRDVTEEEYLRLQQLAQQVFLVESQRHDILDLEADEDSVRSFIFIIYPPEADINTSIDMIKNRVSFRSVVLGLLAHQLLIQTLGTVLLHGSESSLSTEQNLLSSGGLPVGGLARQDSSENQAPSSLPGLLSYLSAKNLSLLLECFVQSYQTAYEFNSRPGLKFLLQKVAKFEVAVNLYWQAGMSFTFYLHTLLEVCHHIQVESMDKSQVKSIVKELCIERGSPESNEPRDVRQTEEADQTERPRSHTADSTTSAGSKSSSRGRANGDYFNLSCELTFNPSNAGTADLGSDLSWIVKRLFGICNDVSSCYIQMHMENSHQEESLDRTSDLPLFFLVAPKAAEFDAVVGSDDSTPEEPTDNTNDKESKPQRKDEDVAGDDEESSTPKNESKEGEVSSPSEEDGRGEESQDGENKDWKFATQWSPKLKCVQLSDEEHIVDVLHKKGQKKQRRSRKPRKSPSGEDGSVYTVATKKTIKSLMQEYKRRKSQHSRSVFVKKPTFKEQKYIKLMEQRDLSLSPEERRRRREIQEEQKSSIMRDTDAMVTTWSEMILTLLQLLQLLPDDIFQRLLPVVFPSVSQLICHVTNGKVRSGILDFMERVALLNDIV